MRVQRKVVGGQRDIRVEEDLQPPLEHILKLDGADHPHDRIGQSFILVLNLFQRIALVAEKLLQIVDRNFQC